MDEVDGMSSGDRGGMQELIRILETTQIPVVCCTSLAIVALVEFYPISQYLLERAL